MWERQVLAAATDHSDTAIRQAMLQSLKGQVLMVTTTLPPHPIPIGKSYFKL